MRLSFCFAAIMVAPYAASSHAQAASIDAPIAAALAQAETRQAPPPERGASESGRIDSSQLAKRELRVGNRTIMVDQFVGDRPAASFSAL